MLNGMASKVQRRDPPFAGLGQNFNCSICQTMYTNPVSLRCGHNFCRVCIVDQLCAQNGRYSCPDCGKRFSNYPELHKNIVLRKILLAFQSPQKSQDNVLSCTNCIHFPAPAIKACLHCEALLCDNHLSVHSKSPEHILAEPTTSLEKRKCSLHKEPLKYYCLADAACICVSCRLDGEHKGHEVESLDRAADIKKKKLKTVLQKLTTERDEVQKKLNDLLERCRNIHVKTTGTKQSVTTLFKDLNVQLEALKDKILTEITLQEKQLLHPFYGYMKQLKRKKDQLSRKMGCVVELNNLTDPVAVLQSDTGDVDNSGEGANTDGMKHNEQNLHEHLDLVQTLHTLHLSLADMIKAVNDCFGVQEAKYILLDASTAYCNLSISDDMTTVSWSTMKQERPGTQHRFKTYAQVLSFNIFCSGRHYWDVDVSKSGHWKIGMSYPSIERRGAESGIGNNDKSWVLYMCNGQCCVTHSKREIQLSATVSGGTIRIYLDYEAGQLSFYVRSTETTHLHTFFSTFTEPLHIAVLVKEGHIKFLGGRQEM
ncbi:tripartite motif-containing protein 75-like [Hyperolius riggenbachi]|uniref:tripartite motif-containing protein 75-like n=1 Tax=Hyperolius riggenbachi TaxID=752182 RepID=UPI0035A3D450